MFHISEFDVKTVNKYILWSRLHALFVIILLSWIQSSWKYKMLVWPGSQLHKTPMRCNTSQFLSVYWWFTITAFCVLFYLYSKKNSTQGELFPLHAIWKCENCCLAIMPCHKSRGTISSSVQRRYTHILSKDKRLITGKSSNW